MATADSSSPATTKTKSSNHFIPVAQWLNSELGENKNLPSQPQFFKRLQDILDAEGVEYDNKVLVELINKHFPDWRRVLNECQRYAVGGKIDTGILTTFKEVAVNDLVKNLKEKNFSEVRKWCVNAWTMILVFFCAMFTIIFIHPWTVLPLLLLFLLLLNINTNRHSC